MKISHRLMLFFAIGIAGYSSAQASDVTPNSVFDGAAFWIYPVEAKQLPFIFRWHGDQAYVSTGTSAAPHSLSISKCSQLQEAIAQLNASVAPSVQTIATPQSGSPDEIYVGRVRYVLKYYADHSLNWVRLESYDPAAVLWVGAAVAVKDRAIGCLAGS